MTKIKCVIAAGGLGTRLQGFRQNDKTKILLEVNGMPMINRQINQINNWGIEEFIIITSPDFDELEKFDCIPHFKEANNALKEIENDRITDHKNRNNYKKVTYPLYLKTETYINFLKINDSKWDLIKFLNSHSFKTK